MSESELRPLECALVAADAVVRALAVPLAVLTVIVSQALLGCVVFLARLLWAT